MTIPEAAVEVAAAYVHEQFHGSPLSVYKDGYQREYKDAIRAALEAAAPYMLAGATKLIRDLTDPDDCQFDHHGGCQAHGYLSLEQGETCPQADAKEWAL